MQSLTLDDDGFLDLTIGGVTQRIDVYQSQNRLFEISKSNADKPAEDFHKAVVALLEELGFPPPSHRLADRFVEAIAARVDELKKNSGPPGGTTPASPSSTA